MFLITFSKQQMHTEWLLRDLQERNETRVELYNPRQYIMIMIKGVW